MGNINLSIIDKIKNVLNINEDISDTELYTRLYNARNLSHPDKVDVSLEKKARDRFNNLTDLLNDFKIYLDRKKLENSGSLTIIEDDYEKVIDKSNILILEKEINELKKKLNRQKKENKKLKFSLKRIQEDRVDSLAEKLKKYYEPKKSSFLVLGGSAFILILVNISSQIKNLGENLKEFLPIQIEIFNSLFLIVFIIFFIKILYKNLKYHRIQNISEELKSSTYITSFCEIYSEEHSDYFETRFFLESQIEKSIRNRYANKKFKSGRWYRKESLIKRLGEVVSDRIKKPIGINDQKSQNYLKDIFIYNLITKGYVKFGKTDNLDRVFIVE